MPDRSHVKQSLPCGNHGCDGFAICEGGSKVRIVKGKPVRVRKRTCEKCGRVGYTEEVEVRVIYSGRRVSQGEKVLPTTKQLTLF